MTASITPVIKKLLLLFLIFAGLYFAKAFLMPLFIGGILATLFLPFCNWMEKKKTPKSLAVFICLLSLMLLISSIAALLGWKIYDLVNDFTLMKKVSIEALNSVQVYVYDHLDLSFKEQNSSKGTAILWRHNADDTGINGWFFYQSNISVSLFSVSIILSGSYQDFFSKTYGHSTTGRYGASN
jgi:predicted PurR-regulated permease PerM